MTYLEYFELSQEPFSNAPVSRFYYNSSQHSQALTRLLHTVSYMKGLSVLIGDIGAGKTTLARRMLDSLPEEEYEAALLVIIHSGITANWLLKRIALQLGVENPAQEKLALLSQLYQRLLQIYEAGKKAVVLIDEAQMLETRELMEEFRGLLNLEVPERKLISFVFFGLPEIERNLKLDPPLAQRVAMRYRLEPFSADSTEAYIKHRLRLAGCPRMPFTADAIEALHRRSGGTPRVINTLCDNALFEAFLARMPDIGGTLIEQIADNLGLETGRGAPQPTVAALAAASAQPPPPPPEILEAEAISEEVALPAAAALERSGVVGLDPVWSAAVAPKRPSSSTGSWSAAVAPPPAAPAPAAAPVQVTLGQVQPNQTSAERLPIRIRPEAMAPERAPAGAPPAPPVTVPSPLPVLFSEQQQQTASERLPIRIRPEAMAPEPVAALTPAGTASNAKVIASPTPVTVWRAPLPAPLPHAQQPTASGRIPVRLKPLPPPPPPAAGPKPAPPAPRIATPIHDAATPPAAPEAAVTPPTASPVTGPQGPLVSAETHPVEEPLLTATVEEEIPIETAEEPVNPQAPAASKARGVDLAEIDRYLEGLNKL